MRPSGGDAGLGGLPQRLQADFVFQLLPLNRPDSLARRFAGVLIAAGGNHRPASRASRTAPAASGCRPRCGHRLSPAARAGSSDIPWRLRRYGLLSGHPLSGPSLAGRRREVITRSRRSDKQRCWCRDRLRPATTAPCRGGLALDVRQDAAVVDRYLSPNQPQSRRDQTRMVHNPGFQMPLQFNMGAFDRGRTRLGGHLTSVPPKATRPLPAGS